MPRPALTVEQRDELRKRIKEAASRLGGSQDVNYADVHNNSNISIRKIAKEAGISVGTFYTYFDSLADLAQSMWSEPVRELELRMRNDFEKTEGAVNKIRILLEHYVRFSKEFRSVFRGAFLFVRPGGAVKPEVLSLKDTDFYNMLCNALEEGQRSGELASFNVREMAQTCWAGIHGALALPVNLDRYKFDSADAISANMIDALLSIISNNEFD